jgi:hypothetical protein
VDILRTEQVRASMGAKAEGGRTGFHRWRRRGLLLAVVVVVVVAGAAATFLQTSGPSYVNPGVPPDSAIGAALVQSIPEPPPSAPSAPSPKDAQSQPPQGVAEGDAPTERPVEPAPVRAVPGAFSLSPPDPSVSAPADQNAADLPNGAEATSPPAAVTVRPEPIEPLAPQHETDAIASAPPAGEGAKVHEPDTVKPVLWVYYPQGSSRAEANARSLSARMGSSVTSADFKAQTNPPNGAVIKFSEKKDHALARKIGKSLGDSGYRWKIENSSSSVGPPRNTIEVWLPMK